MNAVAIHQPEFMPWIGFFNKMSAADSYVVLDHVQFKKRYFENRNRVVTPRGEVLWVGVPVLSKGRYTQAIRDVEIEEDGRWARKLLERVRHAYAKAPYFHRYYPELEALVAGGPHKGLAGLNLELIGFFRRHFGIATPMLYSSDLGVSGSKGSELILDICLKAGARTYLCGANGRNYLKEEDFEKAGVAIEYLGYTPPSYPQLCPNHVSHLSSLDLLFNVGPEAGVIVTGQTGGKP